MQKTFPSQTFIQIVPFSILTGLAVPIPFWILHRIYPKSGAKHVITPILCCKCLQVQKSTMFHGVKLTYIYFPQDTLGYLSVGINSSIFTTFCIAMFSQYYLRKYRPGWFRKYNFLLSAALDGGTQVNLLFVFWARYGIILVNADNIVRSWSLFLRLRLVEEAATLFPCQIGL
jgi:hypothetical protein